MTNGIITRVPRRLRGYFIKNPSLLFSPDGSAKAATPYEGFRKYCRPFDLESRNISTSVKLIVFTLSKYKDRIVDLLRKLRFGVRRFPGLYSWFHIDIDEDNLNIIEFDFGPEDVKSGMVNLALKYEQFLLEHKNDLRKYDLCVVTIPHTPPIQIYTPYYIAKGVLANLGIPSQMITFEVLENPRVLEWSVGNIALQMYVKLGGIPWVLHTSLSEFEQPIFPPIFTIGFDYTIRRYSLAGKPEEIVAYAILLRENGSFYFLKGVPVVTESEELNEALIKILDEAITDLKREFKEKFKDKVSICVQYYRRMKESFLDNVEEIMHKHGVDYIIIRVSKHPLYRIYDKNYQTYLPPPGIAVELTKKIMLVLTVGRIKGLHPPIGVPHPVIIELLRTNFKTSDIFTQRVVPYVYYLTFMNWRSLRPMNSMPSTMIYATLIARIAKSLRETKYWNSIISNQELSKKAWFI